MGSDNGAFSIRGNLTLLQRALVAACELYGEPVDRSTRAALGYFILRAAREGERDAGRLAIDAVRNLRARPDILDDPFG